MATVDHLSKLLQAVADQDWPSARLAGARLVEAEEKKGHFTAAQALRGALRPNGHQHSPDLGRSDARDVAFLSAALSPLDGVVRLADVSLRVGNRREIEEVVQEWRCRELLVAHGVPRRRKLLFHGPPGCGKSITARALAGELSLPTYVIRIDAVVGAYLGQTALRVRQLFHFAETTPCVLLLDEIDALGRRRGHQQDIGEIDRVVISLMQELEHAAPAGVVVATSNLPEHLDPALFRRFDQVVEFPRPTHREVLSFGAALQRRRRLTNIGSLGPLLRGATNYAEVERRIVAKQRAVLLAKGK